MYRSFYVFPCFNLYSPDFLALEPLNSLPGERKKIKREKSD